MLPTLLRAPAKLNLTLEVLGRRADGYHTLRSLMVPLELADELQLERSAEGFSFDCDDPALAGEENLAVRAFESIAPPTRNVRLALRKRIPRQAGLGGGSSDAAAVLLAAMAGHLGAGLKRDWLSLAARLGSDVPFFLCETGALVEGTGARVTPVGTLPSWHALLVKPPEGISTADAYAALDRGEFESRLRRNSSSLQALQALQRADFDALQAVLQNDFTGVVSARTPAVVVALAALRRAGATNPILTGSGSCVFALAPDEQEIALLAERLMLPAGYRRFQTRFRATPAWQIHRCTSLS
ncbi:MAG: 4-(cytidine 5'-diphospho)-2-C-methyl-D-erythritol kinase [Vulcanimicrobiaceae bacterium]